MKKNFTIMETREMSKHKLEAELVECSKRIEELGMDQAVQKSVDLLCGI